MNFAGSMEDAQACIQKTLKVLIELQEEGYDGNMKLTFAVGLLSHLIVIDSKEEELEHNTKLVTEVLLKSVQKLKGLYDDNIKTGL